MSRISTDVPQALVKSAVGAGLVRASGSQRGLERGTSDDMILPKIMLVQATSSALIEKGGKPGDFMNSLTGESLKTVEIVPIAYSGRKYRVYHVKNKNERLFLFEATDRNDPRLIDKRFRAEGDEAAEVDEVMPYLCMSSGSPVVVSFSKTSLEAGKKLFTYAKLSRGDLFATRYKLFSTKKVNPKGQTYFVMDVEPAGPVTPEELASAEETYRTLGARVDALKADEAV